MDTQADVVIVGAGLAGLACALELQHRGITSLILEASDGVGGRVRTDNVDGFLLDRGFQVMLTAYPEARRLLEYDRLDFHAFSPGALVWMDGRFHRLADPLRQPGGAFKTLASPTGNLADKLRIGRLWLDVRSGSLADLFNRPETTTLNRLRRAGFSQTMIDRFFRPFFGGVFLESSLRTSSRLFDFVFRMMAEGDIAVPAAGMGAIPAQLAAQLPNGTIRLNSRVESVTPSSVRLASSEEVTGRAVVVATNGAEAARLLRDVPDPGFNGATCLYFAADQAPTSEPILMLNGEATGPVNNVAVMSAVGPTYAPADSALISVTLLGVSDTDDDALIALSRSQLSRWFGPQVDQWRHLRTYRIPNALPDETPPALSPAERPVRLAEGLFVCGDHRDNASINGALVSGRRAGEAVAAELGRPAG